MKVLFQPEQRLPQVFFEKLCFVLLSRGILSNCSSQKLLTQITFSPRFASVLKIKSVAFVLFKHNKVSQRI